MITDRKLTIKQIAEIYKISQNTVRTYLCRPEFNQFRTLKKKGKTVFIFKNTINFHKMLTFFIKNKSTNKKYNVEVKELKWNISSINCYKRGCVCNGCEYSNLSEQCKMKSAVIELVRVLGRPI